MKKRHDLRHTPPPQERGKEGISDRAALDGGALWLPEEAAAFLRVPRSQVMTLVRKDFLPCVRVGRFIRFREEDLDAWAKNGGSVPKEGVTRGDH